MLTKKLNTKFKLLSLSVLASCSIGSVAATPNLAANPFEVNLDVSGITLTELSATKAPYIVQVKGLTGVEQAVNIGELTPNNQLAAGNMYNAQSPAMQAYNERVRQFHQQLAAQQGISNILHSYTHTFNGFSVVMTADEAQRLQQHPDVVGVWLDEPMQLDTANTPEFLGLNGADGQHTLGVKGENVVIGIIDSGIWPESPSFADDGSYPALESYTGVCDSGLDETFSCNNKLIGARYFNQAFTSVYNLQPGEYVSPRDADSHGTHVAATAGGNERVQAIIDGQPAGFVTGIAPRARIAAYKACWNSSYTSPTGVAERGCFGGDTMAAIDAAVADGVDVINYSISGSTTNLTTIAAAAKLRAAQAGVFVSVSAGNSGPGAGTVGTPAPWVMSVAASTYDGTSYVAGSSNFTVLGGAAAGNYQAVEASTTVPLATLSPIEAEVAVANPILACTELTNAADLAGKLVVMQRGVCGFDIKLAAAQAAGAVGAVVINSDGTAPIVMGGTGRFTIPGVMISLANGQTIVNAVNNGETVTARLAPGALQQRTEVGNIMAAFSSRGANMASADIIKPDITAPGVRILAAGSEGPMLSRPNVPFIYLQGTSMSSPHIAGMAALLREAHPDWSPAMIKSALMTTARQNVTKENGVTAADPFDFGAGHAVPASAANPGLVYDITAPHYYAFLCGLNANAFVQSATGFSCDTYANAGYSFDASQLNLPSIGIGQLDRTRLVYREVKDVSGAASVYNININAPAGINATALVMVDGQWIESNTLNVPANGVASYAVRFSTTATSAFNNWRFGSLTLSNGTFDVRSPIAIRAVEPPRLEAPAVISAQVAARSGRVTFPVLFNYTGTTSTTKVGLAAPFGASRTIPQDPDRTFQFNEASLGTHILLIPEGTRVARFMLNEGLASVPGADLDLYVYRCINNSCSFIASSTNDGGFEDIVLRDPAPAGDASANNFYIVWVHPYDLKGAASVTYTIPMWIVDQNDNVTSQVISATRAVNGRYNNITLNTRNLQASPFPYMGVMSFNDDSGTERGSTLLEIRAN